MIEDVEVSFLDVGGHVSLLIFVSGCSGPCDYCYNKILWEKRPGRYTVEDIQKYLENNDTFKFVDGFSITGAEPISRPEELAILLRDLRSTFPGFYINLDTSLTQGRIKEHLGYLDRISVSVKDFWFSEWCREDVTENLKSLSESDLDIYFRVNPSVENYDLLLDTISRSSEFLDLHKIKRFCVTPILRNKKDKLDYPRVDLRSYNDFVTQLRRVVKNVCDLFQ